MKLVRRTSGRLEELVRFRKDVAKQILTLTLEQRGGGLGHWPSQQLNIQLLVLTPPILIYSLLLTRSLTDKIKS